MKPPPQCETPSNRKEAATGKINVYVSFQACVNFPQWRKPGCATSSGIEVFRSCKRGAYP